MTPKASIITVTNRIGGLDVLFESLARQTRKDFELILVDALYPYRADLVAAKAKGYSFPVQHIEPVPNQFPRAEQSKSFNAALEHVRSPLVVYECDYTWLGEDTVEAHLDFQARHPGCCWMGDFFYVDLPPHATLEYGTPSNPSDDETHWMVETTQVALRYASDLKSGRLSHLLWSIFDDPPKPPFAVNYRHEKKELEQYDGDWNYWSFKNESLPTEFLLQVNGHDESYDGAHSKNDSELAYRLREHGAQLWSGPRGKGAVYCVNPRDILACRALDRPRTCNDVLQAQSKLASLRIPVNPSIDLRERRNARLYHS